MIANTEPAVRLEIPLSEFAGRADRGGLGQLKHQACNYAILPVATTVVAGQMDPIDALRHMRNALAQGTSDVHTPAMALKVASLCASAIDFVFAAKTVVTPNPKTAIGHCLSATYVDGLSAAVFIFVVSRCM